jgi:immune inhibitor A
VKRSKLALILAVIAILVTSLAAPGLAAPGTNATQVKLGMPEYTPLDRDARADAAAAGKAIKGKQFNAGNPGHSYKSPGDGTTVGNIDVRGNDHKGIALLVDWPDAVPGVNFAQIPQAKFNDLLNGTTYNPYDLPEFASLATYQGQVAPTNKTLKNYYNEVSYNQFGIQVDVYGWFTLPHGYDYYLGQNKGHYNDNGDAFIGELVWDAVQAAKAAGVDFTKYAVPAKPGDFADLYGNATSFVDKNGNTVSQILPNLFIIHRGTGAEYSADPSVIWSHKWDILSANYFGQYYRTGTYPADSTLEYKTLDGIVVNTYNTVPEVGQDITGFLGVKRAPSPPYVGVFAHEFGHVLGLPDLYDYGYDSEGVGDYTLMAGGSYGRSIKYRYYSGNSPANLDGWSKQYLGFLKFKEIYPATAKQTITLKPTSVAPDIYRLHIPGADNREYFLLENRQPVGFDEGMTYYAGPTIHGLLVYQVDETVLARTFHRPNEGNNWDWNKRGDNFRDAGTGENHYAVSVIQADGRYDLEHGYNSSDPGDTFSGSSPVTTLLPNPVAGQPNTVSWFQWLPSRSITGITLSNVHENADGSVTLDVIYQ